MKHGTIIFKTLSSPPDGDIFTDLSRERKKKNTTWMPFDALSILRKLKGPGLSGCHATNPFSRSTLENVRRTQCS